MLLLLLNVLMFCVLSFNVPSLFSVFLSSDVHQNLLITWSSSVIPS